MVNQAKHVNVACGSCSGVDKTKAWKSTANPSKMSHTVDLVVLNLIGFLAISKHTLGGKTEDFFYTRCPQNRKCTSTQLEMSSTEPAFLSRWSVFYPQLVLIRICKLRNSLWHRYSAWKTEHECFSQSLWRRGTSAASTRPAWLWVPAFRKGGTEGEFKFGV